MTKKLVCPHCKSEFYKNEMILISAPDLGCPYCCEHIATLVNERLFRFGIGGSGEDLDPADYKGGPEKKSMSIEEYRRYRNKRKLLKLFGIDY